MKKWLDGARKVILENRWHLLAAILIMVIGALAGFLFARAESGAASALLRKLADPLTRLAEKLASRPSLYRAAYIFMNNVRASLLIALGGLVLGFIPPLILFANGMLIGLLGAELTAKGALTPLGFITSLAPHGIFELPAIWLAAMIGLRLGKEVWTAVLTGEGRLKHVASQAFTLLPLVLALLIIAAGLEVYVTPLLMRY